MPDRTRGYAHRVDVRADIYEVWQSLIDPAQLVRWCSPQVRIDPREGGIYWFRPDPELTREAHIDVFLAPRRLRLIYMPLPELPDEGAVIVDDFLLDIGEVAARDGGGMTVLRLLGSGVPDDRAWDAMHGRLRVGWERALLRLRSLFEPPPAKRSG
jgi:uncharacterized protein YndB with AHSA1/START domain